MTRYVTDQWGQGRDTILQMHREGQLETIPANTGHVDLLLQRADANLATVTQIQTTNPGLAYDGLYDAARFALTAILAQQGLRPTRAGGHLAVASSPCTTRSAIGRHYCLVRQTSPHAAPQRIPNTRQHCDHCARRHNRPADRTRATGHRSACHPQPAGLQGLNNPPGGRRMPPTSSAQIQQTGVLLAPSLDLLTS